MKTSIKKKENKRTAPTDRERKPELNSRKNKEVEEKPKKVWNPAALYF
jgi:hypothetical protein